MLNKKIASILFVLVFSLTATLPVLAADEWTPFQPLDGSETSAIECSIVGPLGANAQVAAILPAITAEDWSIGPEDAPLTILEYADYQCPYCATVGVQLYEFQQKYPDDVRYVYRHFPLSYHEKAPLGAYAADAAGKQGVEFFFEISDFFYRTQNDWTAMEPLESFETWMKDQIKTGFPELDYDQWLVDYEDADIRAKVDGAFEQVASYGIISGTPSVFLNFNSYQGPFDDASLRKYVDLFKLQARVFNACPPVSVDETQDYRAVMDTTKGQITFDLLAENAPLAVNSFIYLADEGWFDAINFHRIVDGFVAQTGDPSGTGLGTPGYFFADESGDVQFGEPGVVGMANSGANRNGSQFFFTYDLADYYRKSIVASNDTLADESKLTDAQIEEEVQKQLTSLSASYTVFGKITDGYDVVESLQQGDQILAVKIEQKPK